MAFKVFGWKILVKPEEPKKSLNIAEGVDLEIPEAYRARGKFGYASFGEIVQISDQLIAENKTIEKLNIIIGSKVIFEKYAGYHIKIDEVEHRVIRPEDIIAVVEED